jgi:hypothetical protein
MEKPDGLFTQTVIFGGENEKINEIERTRVRSLPRATSLKNGDFRVAPCRAMSRDNH